jgi:hypothetical protein
LDENLVLISISQVGEEHNLAGSLFLDGATGCPRANSALTR